MATLSSKSSSSFMAAIILLLGLYASNLDLTGAESIGVCYGMMSDNLPSPWEVVDLYKSNNIRKMRLYEPNPDALQALRGSNIEVMVGVPNSDLQSVSDASGAQAWVQQNILSYWPSVMFKYIVVGNEVSPHKGDDRARYVLPSIVNIFNAIRSAGLQYQIMVSTSIDMSFLGKSYPPSEGAFRWDVKSHMDPIIGHLDWAGAPLLVSVYPYQAYSDDPTDISLEYATFTSPSPVVWDQGRGYQNLLDAMVDAVYSAVENAWQSATVDAVYSAGPRTMRLIISESGWPSRPRYGRPHEDSQAYLLNLVTHVEGETGTPKRPDIPLDVYMFALFDENQKGSEEEDSFGLFYPDKQPKYDLSFGGARIWNASSAEYNATFSLKADM
ncbi:hypothetical protein PTKIN_Ptkin09bG0010800 [Pterospermum kingtungense]